MKEKIYYKDKSRNESKERTRERKLCEKGGIAKPEDELFAEESAQSVIGTESDKDELQVLI